MRSRLTLPVIAGLAVITAIVVIVLTLRSSPSAPSDDVALATAPPSENAKTAVPPQVASSPKPSTQPHVSAAAGKDLQQAQMALQKKQYDAALADLDRVKATPGKNEYDVFLMNRFYVTAYVGLRLYQDAIQALDPTLNSRFMKADEQQKQLETAALLHYEVHDYGKAIEYGERAMSQGTTNSQLSTVIAQAHYLSRDWAGAERIEEKFVGYQVGAGAVPDKASLQLWSAACFKLRDNVCQMKALEKLNAYYPSAQSQRLLDDLRSAR
jgi:hypothetical protein